MTKIALVTFGVLVSLAANAGNTLTTSKEEAIVNALSTSDGRIIIKRGIESWSNNDKAMFKNNLEERVEQEFIPNLPMRINKFTTWVDLRLSAERLTLTVQIFDEAISDPSILQDYFNNFDTYICSTPVNILFMMLGYSINTSFYDSNGEFMRTKILSESDCNF